VARRRSSVAPTRARSTKSKARARKAPPTGRGAGAKGRSAAGVFIAKALSSLDGPVVRAKGSRLKAVRRASKLTPIDDHVLSTLEGPVRLSELFGDRADLLVIHNMGRQCAYCTMWADGLNGLLPHLLNRAAVVLASPDAPRVQADLAQRRGWRFRMVSTQGSAFTREVGFESADGSPWPGVSALHRAKDGTISRTGASVFGPGDDFCPVWPLLDLLKDGPAGWEPRETYGQAGAGGCCGSCG
jgi:predicted dithiol-disulfide oxidoreductase (DUF899 family)